jgi:hypothetical protein
MFGSDLVTQLQALKEIVRALPIHPISIEWRDNIDGTLLISPGQNPEQLELSKEAKLILSQAAQGDGNIHVLESFQGIRIYSGDEKCCAF